MYFKELFLTESSAIINGNAGASGTQLCRDLSSTEQQMILEGLMNNKKFVQMYSQWMREASDRNVKYTDPLVITFNNKKLTLYAANGNLRFGGNTSFGGQEGFYNCQEIEEIDIKDFSKVLKNAKVK
jgi:hypothetical protein